MKASTLNCVLADNWNEIHTKAHDIHGSVERLSSAMNDISDKLQELSSHLDLLNRHIIPPAMEGPKRMERILTVHLGLSVAAMMLVGSLVVLDRIRGTDSSFTMDSSGFTVGGSKE